MSDVGTMAPTRERTFRLIKAVVPPALLGCASRYLPSGVKRGVNRAIGVAGGPVEALLRRRAEARIRASRPRVSRDALIADLEALALPAGSIVFVHSSLKALGYVEGGAATVVDALRTVIVDRGGGTLAMPTFTGSGGMYDTLRSGEVFCCRTSPSRVGAITELFRQQPGVRRSLHPTHSVAALGRQAEWLLEAHHRCVGAFGEGSPLARLLEAGGQLLGLGTSLGPVTFYHVLEDLRPDFPFRVYTPDSPIEAVCRDENGREVRLRVMAHDPTVSRTRIDRPEGEWIRRYVTDYLEAEGGLRWGKVGAGRAWTISARDMYRGLEALLAQGVTIYSTREQVEGRTARGAGPHSTVSGGTT